MSVHDTLWLSTPSHTVNGVLHCPAPVRSGSYDYATPVDQQFQFDYDLSMQQDQRSRSPAASPVRHVTKRPRHAAGALVLHPVMTMRASTAC